MQKNTTQKYNAKIPHAEKYNTKIPHAEKYNTKIPHAEEYNTTIKHIFFLQHTFNTNTTHKSKNQ